MEGSLSEGIISAKRDLSDSQKWLRITAPISPGSSGSPILNANCDVIGVATVLLLDSQSLNFAVPVEIAKSLIANAAKVTPRGFANFDLQEGDEIFVDADYKAAEAALLTSDNVKALKLFKALAKRFPKSSEAFNELGVAYGRLNFVDDAIQSINEAIKLQPDKAVAWSNLGFLLDKKGKRDESIFALEQGVKIRPAPPSAWNLLGGIYAEQKRTDEAVKALLEALKLKPDYAVAWMSLGSVYMDQGRSAEAIRAYEKAVELDPEFADAWSMLATACFKIRYAEEGKQARARWQALQNKARSDAVSP